MNVRIKTLKGYDYIDNITKVSPCCGVGHSYVNFGRGRDINFECGRCGKNNKGNELVFIEEYKNLKRTELIDKMLK